MSGWTCGHFGQQFIFFIFASSSHLLIYNPCFEHLQRYLNAESIDYRLFDSASSSAISCINISDDG
jgi:hypothetical protein